MKFKTLYFVAVVAFVTAMFMGAVVVAQEKPDVDKTVVRKKEGNSYFKGLKSSTGWEKKVALIRDKTNEKRYRPEDIAKWQAKISSMKSKHKSGKYAKKEINLLKKIYTTKKGVVLSKN